jgi:hypothetical protein
VKYWQLPHDCTLFAHDVEPGHAVGDAGHVLVVPHVSVALTPASPVKSVHSVSVWPFSLPPGMFGPTHSTQPVAFPLAPVRHVVAPTQQPIPPSVMPTQVVGFAGRSPWAVHVPVASLPPNVPLPVFGLPSHTVEFGTHCATHAGSPPFTDWQTPTVQSAVALHAPVALHVSIEVVPPATPPSSVQRCVPGEQTPPHKAPGRFVEVV